MLLKALEKASEVTWGVCYLVWWSSAQTELTLFHCGHIPVTNFTKPQIDTLPHHSASHQQPDHDLLTQGGRINKEGKFHLAVLRISNLSTGLHYLHLHFRAFSRRFCPKRLTVIYTYIDTMMAVAVKLDADQYIRSSLGFSFLPKDTLKCRPEDSNQWPSDKSNQFYLYSPESQSHCLNGLHNLYSERHPLSLDALATRIEGQTKDNKMLALPLSHSRPLREIKDPVASVSTNPI